MDCLIYANISLQLASAGEVDRALGIATSMPETPLKYTVLSNIVFAFSMQNGSVERILAIAGNILHENTRSIALEHISKELSLSGRISDAQLIADAMPASERKDSALAQIREIPERASIASTLFACFGLDTA